MGGETGRWQIFRPPRTTMEFFPANRACRKSVPCSSMIVCCRRKVGTCPGTREPKTEKVLRDGNVEIGWGKRSCGLLLCAFFLFSYRTRSGFLLAGGLGSSFAKSSLLLCNVGILLIKIQSFDSYDGLWSQGTPEEDRRLCGLTGLDLSLQKESWLRNAAL